MSCRGPHEGCTGSFLDGLLVVLCRGLDAETIREARQELRTILAEEYPHSISLGYGGDYKLSYLRSLVIAEGHDHTLDSSVLMDADLGGAGGGKRCVGLIPVLRSRSLDQTIESSLGGIKAGFLLRIISVHSVRTNS